MSETINFMINKEWKKDYKRERKNFLLTIAKKCENSDEISDIIGGMLIYNQLIEQLLKEIIICSIQYIKAEIWPTSVRMNLNFDKATFGTLIEYFKQFAVEEYNYDVITKHLNSIKKTRNNVVHHLFDIPDIENIKYELKEYYDKSYKLVLLLNKYYDQISYNLHDLENRVEWNKL